jgi:hypothetical protein
LVVISVRRLVGVARTYSQSTSFQRLCVNLILKQTPMFEVFLILGILSLEDEKYALAASVLIPIMSCARQCLLVFVAHH